jgi:hypothetical protein
MQLLTYYDASFQTLALLRAWWKLKCSNENRSSATFG